MIGPRHVALVGAMGTGKTTVGRMLAERLGRPLRDNDVELARRTGANPAELARDRGLDALHAEEAATAWELLGQSEPAVITTAASTILDVPVRDALRDRAMVVWLHAGPDVLVDRLADPGVRPEFAASLREVVARQSIERDDWYRSVADADFDTSVTTPAEIVEAIATLPQLAGRP